MELDDHYALTLDESVGFEKGELLNCVSFCTSKRKTYTVNNLHIYTNNTKNLMGLIPRAMYILIKCIS